MTPYVRRFAFNTTDKMAAELIDAAAYLGQPLSEFLRRAIEDRVAEVQAEQVKRPKRPRVEHDQRPAAA